MGYADEICELFYGALYSTTNGQAPQFVHDIHDKGKEADAEIAAKDNRIAELEWENRKLRDGFATIEKQLATAEARVAEFEGVQ